MLGHNADVRLDWLLPALLRRRHLTPAAFAAVLRHRGYPISDSQMYRLVQHTPERYSRKLLETICAALQCSVADLLLVVPESEDVSLLPPKFRLPGT